MQGLRVLLLGQGRLELDGQALTRLLAPKQQALVFYLAAAGAPVARSKLAELLWSELDEASARSNLRGALSRMRRWLPDLLAVDAQQVGFDPGAALHVDLLALTRALSPELAPAERLAAAEAWRGPLLDGFEVGGADGFERWMAQTRQRAQREVQALRQDLLLRSEAQGRLDEAVAHARALLDIDDTDEAAHIALMRLLAATGRRVAAIAQYEACRAALMDRLGARPSAECYALYARIHANSDAPTATPTTVALPDASEVPDAACAPVPPSQAAQADMGAPAPQLIGREAELVQMYERLADPACRWLTVTGPGGVGKTRLARAAAAALGPRLRHGVLWLSGRDDAAGSLQDAESLAQRVVAHTGTDRQAADALLLVLDNLETVPAARSFETMLRARAPGVKVLATSRVRVGGGQEWLLELGGLSLVPDLAQRPPSSPAAQLFAAAARRLVPGFDAAAQASAVERICRLVEGLPLALEMAARSVHTAGVAPVLERLEKGTPLADGDRDTADRHHSLQTVLDDSWALLDEPTRSAALRLAQLAGGFDAELALAVGAGDAALTTLRSHSWLALDSDAPSDGRLRFHPLQQAYLRRLGASPALGPAVLDSVVRLLDERMPAVQPFGDLPPDDAVAASSAALLAASACGSAPLLAAAARHQCGAAQPTRLANWIDRAVALLLQANRQAEAAALLTNALERRDLPLWQCVGWGLRRAELLNGCGASTAALRSYVQAFALLGLCDADIDQAPWAGLVRSGQRLLALQGWPAHEPARTSFSTLLLRSLYCAVEQLAFSPDQRPLMRISLVADLLSRRLHRDGDMRARLGAFASAAAGHPRIAHWAVGLADRRLVKEPVSDLRTDALARENRCVLLLGLGEWAGLAQAIDDLVRQFARLRCGRHEMSTRSLAAKLAFYQGRLVDAYQRFDELSELSLSRPGESWRAWGPIGLVEVGLCLACVDDDTLRRHYERAALVMTEMENIDAAYTLRRLGLAARLAWRTGDVTSALAAVQAGVAAARRMQSNWWAHEGYAGLGDTWLALYSRELHGGGVLRPLEDAWRAFEPALAMHARRFPPAAALRLRLLGARAMAQGRSAEGQSLLQRAVAHSEQQGMRVELARACQALALSEPGSAWAARVERLWLDMGARSVAA